MLAYIFIVIIFLLHEALLIADLASDKEWYFGTWVLYFVAAFGALLLLFAPSRPWLGSPWVAFHGIFTLASGKYERNCTRTEADSFNNRSPGSANLQLIN
jgi:hypothetical protein